MSKRKLNHQQQRVIAKQQDKRVQQAQHSGQVPGLVIEQYGKTALVEVSETPQDNAPTKVVRARVRQNLGELGAGDQVLVNTEHVIEAILPRQHALTRVDRFGKLKLVAANCTQLVIVTAIEPEMSSLLLDSYLVVAQAKQLKCLIVLNKIDLLPEHHPLTQHDVLQYQQLGYRVLALSVKNGDGLAQLQQELAHEVSVFVGQSGVGKSSLIHHLIPDPTIRIAAESLDQSQGKHTTSSSTLYHLKTGGDLIDSPGVREFIPEQLTRADIDLGFAEITKLQQHCYYRNCTHQHEPDCAVKAALDASTLIPSRYYNYLKLLSTHNE